MGVYGKQGHYEVIDRLCRSENLDLNLLDKNGNTALHHAASRGDLRIIQRLLCERVSKTLNVNIQNNNTETALIIAARHNHRKIMEELLENGEADEHLYDNHGKTASDYFNEHEQLTASAAAMVQVENNNNICNRESAVAQNLYNDEEVSSFPGSNSPNETDDNKHISFPGYHSSSIAIGEVSLPSNEEGLFRTTLPIEVIDLTNDV